MNARISMTELAKNVGVSREVVNYRLKQLETKKIIEGYYAVLDTAKLGIMYSRILYKYKQMSKEKENELLEYCRKSPNIAWVSLNDGRWDITIIPLIKNISTLELIYDDINIKFGKFLHQPYLSFAFKIYHFKHNYLHLKNEIVEHVMGDKFEEKIKFDETDDKILKVISNDARISLLDIAKKIKSTPKLVAYRLKKTNSK